MGRNKDSAEVIEFRSLFTRLRDWCDDEPESLPGLAERDEGLRKLCGRLSWAAFRLTLDERRHPQLFTGPVDPKFLAEWRDYEERFQSVLLGFLLLDLPELQAAERDEISGADLAWENADEYAADQVRGIGEAIAFADAEATDMHRDFPKGLRETIQEGIIAWLQLTGHAGFDLRGVFRRREMVPFVLVPRHVAGKHRTNVEPMLRNLQQAHDAFVFGAPLACLALMRSIMETLLRDHYGVEGADLSERIDSASKHLPKTANAAALHRLRRLANDVLHLGNSTGLDLAAIEPIKLEQEIISLLFVLRGLIEGVPQGGHAR